MISRAAAECVDVPACDALKQASLVFVADVTWAGIPAERIDKRSSRAVPQRVQLKVVERFKGVSNEQRVLETSIAFASAETVFLTQGRRYLIYARMREDGTWDTSCSGTKPIDEATDDLRQLRQCRLARRGMRAVPQPTLTDLESYAVYAAVIGQATRRREEPVLIADETRSQSAECVPQADSTLPAWQIAVDDYLRRRHSRLRLLPQLPLPEIPYRMVSEADRRDLVRRRKPRDVVGYVILSAVGFDATRTMAIVHRVHACATGDCGDGEDLSLEKQGGTWRIVRPQGFAGCGWIS